MDFTRWCVMAGLIVGMLAGCVADPEDVGQPSSAQIYKAPEVIQLSAAAGEAIKPQSFNVTHSEGELLIKEHDNRLAVTLNALSNTQTEVTVASLPLPLQQSAGVLVLQLNGTQNKFAGVSIPVEFDIYEEFDVSGIALLRTHINSSAEQFWDDFDQASTLDIQGGHAHWHIECDDDRVQFSQTQGVGRAAVTVSFTAGALFNQRFTEIAASVVDQVSGEKKAIDIGVLAYGGIAVIDREISFTLNPNGDAKDLVTQVRVIPNESSIKAGLHTNWSVTYLPKFVTATPMTGNTSASTELTLTIDVNHPAFTNYQFSGHSLHLTYDGLDGDSQYLTIDVDVNTPLINETSLLTGFAEVESQLAMTMHQLEDLTVPKTLNINLGPHALVAENIQGTDNYLLEYPKLPAGEYAISVNGSENYQIKTLQILPQLALADQSIDVGNSTKLLVDDSASHLVSLDKFNHQLSVWSIKGQEFTPVTCTIDGDVKDIEKFNGRILVLTRQQVYRLSDSVSDCDAAPLITERYDISAAVVNLDYQNFYRIAEGLAFSKFPEGMLSLDIADAEEYQYTLTEAIYYSGVGVGSINLGLVTLKELLKNDFRSPWVSSGNGLYVAGYSQGVRFGRVYYPFSESDVITTAGHFDFRGEYFLSASHQLFRLENSTYQLVTEFENVQLSKIENSGRTIYTLRQAEESFWLEVFDINNGELVSRVSRKVNAPNITGRSQVHMAIAGDKKTVWVYAEGKLYTVDVGL